MGLIVADVVELPKKKPMSNEKYNKWDLEARGYNQCLSEISSLKLFPEKVVGMVEIDKKKLIKIMKDLLLTPKPLDKPKPTIAELEKILNSPEGESLAMLANGEIFNVRPKFSIEKLADAIISNKSKILGVKKEICQ